MVLNRRDFLKAAGILATYLAVPLRRHIPKAYAQQNTLEDIASLELPKYVVQKYDLNDGTLTTTRDIEKKLIEEGEFLNNFTGFNLNGNNYLLGLVSGNNGDRLYFNDKDSLEKRIDVTDYVGNLIGAEPKKVRTAKFKSNNAINNIALIYDKSGEIHGVSLNPLKYLGNLTQVFENAFGYVPTDVLSGVNEDSNSPDKVLALQKSNGKWAAYSWRDIEKGVFKPLKDSDDINLEKLLFDVPYKTDPIISINSDGNNLYAIRKINMPKEWEWKFEGLPSGSEIVGDIKVDTNDENVWYVGTDNGLYVTRNGGWNWEHPLLTGSQHSKNIVLTEQSIYVGTEIMPSSRLYRSDDQGRRWKTVKEFPNTLIDSIHVSRDDPNEIYVGAFSKKGMMPDGVWRSLDKGATWTFHPYDGNSRELITWDIDEGIDGTLYVGTEIADHPKPYYPPFFRSTDKGETWENISNGLPSHVTSIQTHPYKNIVYALTEGSGLYLFDHNNKRWELVESPPSYIGSHLLLDTLNPNRLFIGEVVYKNRNGGVYMSTDSGRTFSPIGLENITVPSLALNKTSTELYAAGRESGIWSMRIPGK